MGFFHPTTHLIAKHSLLPLPHQLTSTAMLSSSSPAMDDGYHQSDYSSFLFSGSTPLPSAERPWSPGLDYRLGHSPSFSTCSSDDVSTWLFPLSPVSSPASLPWPIPFTRDLSAAVCWPALEQELLCPSDGDVTDFGFSDTITRRQSFFTAAQSIGTASSVEEVSEPPPSPDEPGVCLFVKTLSEMVRDPCSANIIFWSRDGHSLVVLDERSMIGCLTKHYRHGQFSSFVRLLNYHGFTKRTIAADSRDVCHDANTGVGRYRQQRITFTHPSYRRDRKDLLHLIVRKRSGGRAAGDQAAQPLTIVPVCLSKEAVEQSSDTVLVNSLSEQVQQLVDQYEHISRSQEGILHRLEQMRHDSEDKQRSAGEAASSRKRFARQDIAVNDSERDRPQRQPLSFYDERLDNKMQCME